MEQNNFGDFLSKKRKEKNLTQKQFADLLYVTESAVSKWERNKSRPDIQLLGEISKLLGVTEHELITASVDKNQKMLIKNAKKWKTVTTTWDLFFYISYGLALLTCFIVDIATSGSLTWFWIVFCALLLSSTFTTLPKFIKKFKLILIPLFQLLGLIILLAVCNIFTNGDWFLVSIIPVIFTYIFVFLPIVIYVYPFPKFIKRNSALISFFVISILLLFMLFYINIYTSGTWFFNFALPLTLICLTLPFLVVVIQSYFKINQYFKNSLYFALSGIYSVVMFPIVNSMTSETFGAVSQEYLIDLLYWGAEEYIVGNILFLIVAVLAIFTLIYAICGFVKSKNTKLY